MCKPDLSAYVDISESEVMDCLGIWKAVVMERYWDAYDELAYVLVVSLAQKYFKENV